MSKVCLQTAAKHGLNTSIKLMIEERLPLHVASPCNLNCEYSVENLGDYYILNLKVEGLIPINCQRCLDEFKYQYDNSTRLAVCRDEETAEKLMNSYECIVVQGHFVDMTSIVTDELHLYSIDRHLNEADCDVGVSGIIET